MPKKNPYKNSEIKQDGVEIPEVENPQNDEIGSLLDQIKDESEKETYMTLVDRIRVDAESKKEFVLNYLNAIYDTYSDLPRSERLQAYINYFVDTFSYDWDEFNRRTADNKAEEKETVEMNEDRLFKLCYENKGVCQQFAQAFALLTQIDYTKSKDMLFTNYVCCTIKKPERELGHAINFISLDDDQKIVIDISSMIHCKEGKYHQSKENFGPVFFKDYISNLKSENIDLISNGEASKTPYMAAYGVFSEDSSKYYDILNATTEDILTNHQNWLFPITIPTTKETSKQKSD